MKCWLYMREPVTPCNGIIRYRLIYENGKVEYWTDHVESSLIYLKGRKFGYVESCNSRKGKGKAAAIRACNRYDASWDAPRMVLIGRVD